MRSGDMLNPHMRMLIRPLCFIALTAGCADEEDAPSLSSAGEPLAARHAPVLTPQASGITNRLDAVAPVNERVVWASGHLGAIIRTTDGGATWQSRGIPGTATLNFRDIEAFSENVAFVLTNEGGPDARIYKTEDGGQTWTLQFQSPIANTFYDCFAFFNPRRAIAVPDAEDGHFDVVRMTDGHTWENIGDLFPAGQPGEGFFPSSGTCITTLGGRRAWSVTGGAAHPRVIATTDGGDTWASYPIPMGGTATSGGLSILFRDRRHGILGGGDVAALTVQQENFARSSDSGKTWELATPTPFPGPIYGMGYVGQGRGDDDRDGDDHGDHVRIVATGPGGAAWSPDEGDSWESLPADITAYYAVAFANHRTGWLVGASGRIQRIDF
jgi:photosystem II stability/assembly factor-like uncharacterized protein